MLVHPSGPVLVRVAPVILEKLATEGSEPVVILGGEQQDDGTYDMTLKTPDIAAANLRLAQALRMIRDTTDGFGSRHAAATLDELGIEDPEDDCAVF